MSKQQACTCPSQHRFIPQRPTHIFRNYRDVSTDGVFLEMSRTQLNSGDSVGLDVCYDHDGEVNHYRLSAVVVYIHSGGIGLMFQRSNDELPARVQFTRPAFEIFRLQKQAQSFYRSQSPSTPWV